MCPIRIMLQILESSISYACLPSPSPPVPTPEKSLASSYVWPAREPVMTSQRLRAGDLRTERAPPSLPALLVLA